MLTGLLILLPIAGSALVMFSTREKAIRRNALIIAIAELILALVAAAGFTNNGSPGYILSFQWIKGLNIPFIFGMDGLSLLMVLLTVFLIPVIIIASYSCSSRRVNIFFGLILIAEGSLVGVFTALNGIVFYIFWEFALIPVYFIIALWGGENRIRITFKFLIYTLTGSLIMLAALIYLYFQTPDPHSFSFQALYHTATTKESQIWIFLAFFLAFAIKIPVVPFHTWQPDTYTSAPPAGSMILAGIMLKMGIYGIIRLLIPICPLAFPVLGMPVIILVTAGIIYSSVIAIRQDDLKRFIAYVSIAHVGLITAAVLSLNNKAVNGAVFQMIAHGINVVALFIIVDIIEVRNKSRKISELGGIAASMPSLAIVFMIIILASVALPLTSGFVGEFLMLLGLFSFSPWIAAGAGLTIIFSAVYMLWMYQRVMLGNLRVGLPVKQPPLLRNDLYALVPLIIMIFLLGCYPKPVMQIAGPAIDAILKTINILPN
jgi:NADH-quinone oxidoreductase subunit M